MVKSNLDITWILMCALLVFLMQVGFVCLESGLTRTKNAINVAIKNLSSIWISILLFWVLGFALMFGASKSGLGNSSYLLVPLTKHEAWLPVFFLFQAMFCSTAVTIVSGAAAERMRFRAYILLTIIVATLLYPVYGNWAWGGLYTGEDGWLAKLGFIDFAGATVVHSMGGWVALAAVLTIGPRIGRFPENGSPHTIPASNIPLAMVGVMLLAFGWFGFNGGSLLTMDERVPVVITNTLLSAAGGFHVGLILGWCKRKHPDVQTCMKALLAGLVAITATSPVVTAKDALIIGAVGGLVMMCVEQLLEHWRIDDVVGAVPVHLGAGIWGTLAVALFGNAAELGTGLDKVAQIKAQLIGISICGLWSFGLAYILLRYINHLWPLRVSPKDEYIGLNISEHQVKTELIELLHSMDEQAKTQDLGRRVPEEPFTEIGQIAKQYNRVMASLHQAVTHSRQIVHDIKDGIITFTREGLITSFNPAARSIFLCPAQYAIGQSVTSFIELSESDSSKDWIGSWVEPFIDRTQELVGVRKDSSNFMMELTVTKGRAGGDVIYTAVVHDITVRKQAEEGRRLKELSKRVAKSQEEERRRVARELHDGINQLLVSVKYKLETAENGICHQPVALSEASALLDTTIQEIRQISHGLRSSVLDILGFLPALLSLSREFSERTAIDVEISEDEMPVRLPMEVEAGLYRIVQEAFTNIEKHAGASRVQLYMESSPCHFEIRVVDDGIGFNIDDIVNNGIGGAHGIGIQNMQERAKFLGCQFHIHSALDIGTSITVEVQLNAKDGSHHEQQENDQCTFGG